MRRFPPPGGGNFLIVLSALRDCVSIRKNPTLGKGERWSGEKELERLHLALWIRTCQVYDDIRFYAREMISHNLKDPHSEALEPDLLSPPLPAITTQSLKGGAYGALADRNCLINHSL